MVWRLVKHRDSFTFSFTMGIQLRNTKQVAHRQRPMTYIPGVPDTNHGRATTHVITQSL
jgi:hypothetical protein